MEGASRGQRFVHYTSAAAALSIIGGRSVWLRNARYLDDYTEIEHGIDHVVAFFNSTEAEPFWHLMHARSDAFAAEIVTLYNGWAEDMRTNTFVTCLSEHHDYEDDTGRLSMWELYGKSGAPVALVINPEPIFSVSDALSAFTYPVHYGNGETAFALFRECIRAISDNADYVRQMPEQELKAYVFDMLHSFTFTLKNSVFREQLEWRVVHRPSFYPSKRLTSCVETIREVPQTVYRLPLEDVPEEGLVGIDPATLLNRVLIGPGQNRFETQRLFVEQLSAFGVCEAAQKVCVADVPLRRSA